MADVKHTPGPWSEGSSDWSADNDGENTCVSILADGREDPICIVVEGSAWGRDAQLDANARLIAAAPVLLAALKDAHDTLTVHFGHEAPAVIEAARIAIAKAEAA